jgi:hypothetical protein
MYNLLLDAVDCISYGGQGQSQYAPQLYVDHISNLPITRNVNIVYQ